ncbi:hypothetical protein D0C36_14625 [Mucilaginibacter conchicola]|uniref:Carboxypeptidase regulatory-like domain-containing protein n=1 Tax=Mucilaginibacter conchicola TaxID=2303333 RepID=A0A372NTT1_9SPHI|nr:hypothetical protein [Mucilaginibacter conchicola]RFZ92645.1 hypothetical protein D0C36_14625 [Mucilaginibacter conchicola]
MNRKTLSLILSAILIATTFSLQAAARIINIAGLVVDSQTLSPVVSAEIYDDATHKLLGSTNSDGYYKVAIHYDRPGEIFFKLRVVKTGYRSSTQNEHWGNMNDGAKSIMYFGLQQKGSKIESFSSLNAVGPKGSIEYADVLNGFSSLKERRGFDNQLAHAKRGNQHIFVMVDDTPYLVNNTGWIKLTSADDNVLIDDKKVIPANKLNGAVKRSKIKWMSPVTDSRAGFAVHTH